MLMLLLGLALLIVVLWALNSFTTADPRKLAPFTRSAGGVAALALAAFFAWRGLFVLAAPLGLAGLGLLGWAPMGTTFARRTRKPAGQVSRVRSAFVEMELDHDTGALRGRILAGRYDGRTLDSLDVATLLSFLPDVDEESRALLMAYLDRRQPGWREHAQNGAAAGPRPAVGGKMTDEEAYQILGLQAGATRDDIVRAHRSLMKKLHPDQGGSTYLAARVNEAKEVLLRRHS